ncbi:MAG: hypothetical protein JW924_03255 [Fusobacteriaceae bacterium]|nr:hypothetical protein [Fusobacteriaceae bacterium]
MFNFVKFNEFLFNSGESTSIPGEVQLTDSILITDEIFLKPSQRKISLEDTLTLSDKISGIFRASYSTKVIYKDNYVYIITNEHPAQLVKVDLSGEVSWITYELNIEGDKLKNAKDFYIDDVSNIIYIACADGKLAKIDYTDPSNKEKIIVDNPNNLTNVESIEDLGRIFIGTDSITAELYELDESEVKSIKTHVSILEQIYKFIRTFVSSIQSKLIKTHLVFLSSIYKIIKTDFRFSPQSYSTLIPIKRTDFVVKIDNVSVSDINLASISIIHRIDERSSAEFVLGRNFDKLDYTLEGASSQITNQNIIKIYLKNNLIFEGTITSLTPKAEGEEVLVKAESNEDWIKSFNKIQLPIASINEQQHLYHGIVQDINILNLKQDIGTTTITNLSCKAGSSRLETTGNQFNEDMVGQSIDIISGNNFVLGTYEIIGYKNKNLVIIDRPPMPRDNQNDPFARYTANASNGIGYIAENPPYYRGIKVDLGDMEVERPVRFSYLSSRTELAELIVDGEFEPTNGLTYFWFVDFVDLGTPSYFQAEGELSSQNFKGFRSIENAYIGTSLAPLSADMYEIYGIGFLSQHMLPNAVTDLGYYYLGEFPYKEINVKSGAYYSKWHWEDKEIGLYNVKGEWYSYTNYAKKIAQLEYEKMKNINGDILPITSANIDLTLDGFLYYNIKLLTRLNIINTTQSNIYNNSKGFPVSVKVIEISSSDMRVKLNTDNTKSEYELAQINEKYPDEPEPQEKEIRLLSGKWNLDKWAEESSQLWDTNPGIF